MAPVPLPDVVDLGVFQAAEVLTLAGFEPVVESRVVPATAEGFVVEQVPPPGEAPQGSQVRIVYAVPEGAPEVSEVPTP